MLPHFCFQFGIQEIMQAVPASDHRSNFGLLDHAQSAQDALQLVPAFCSTSPSVSTHQEQSITEGPQRQALIGPLHLTSTDSQTMVDQACPYQAKLC